jgi:hypothetical protein
MRVSGSSSLWDDLQQQKANAAFHYENALSDPMFMENAKEVVVFNEKSTLHPMLRLRCPCSG